MSIAVFIDGGAGTTGLEIAERLHAREEFSLIVLDDARRKDERARADALAAADFAILCLPDDAARAAVAMIGDAGTRVIDASTAHRTAPGWTYGFPELVGRDKVAAAARVANPGCYPTGFLALVAPLVRAGLLAADGDYYCHAVSGYSGGGKAMIEHYESGETPPAFRAYALTGAHKHLAEMREHAGLHSPPRFAPAVVPTYRGMMVEVPLAPGHAARRLRDALAKFFDGAACVRVAPAAATEELVLVSDPAPSDAMALHVLETEDGAAVRLVAMLDNLGKGAAGAAVQNLNIMAGLPETAGLRLD